MELVKNAAWILTKNGILQKVKRLLEDQQVIQQGFVQSLPGQLTEKITAVPPKISKGENFRGLPYLILDFPRLFEKENIFAIRTLFWWGNFFSTTLHLSGSYKKGAENSILTTYPFLKKSKFHVCVNFSEWDHHFEKDNYVPVKGLSKSEFEKLVRDKGFIKLGQKIPVGKWHDVPELLPRMYEQIISLLKI